MKKLLLYLFILFVAKSANAQYRVENDNKKVSISAGLELGIPGNTSLAISYGASAKAEVRLIKQLSATLTGGYNVYNYKDVNVYYTGSQVISSSQSFIQHPSLIPVKAGLRYYPGSMFYAEGEYGTAFKMNDTSGNLSVYSIGFGFEVPVSQHSDVDIGFRYEKYSEGMYRLTSIRAAYRLGW